LHAAAPDPAQAARRCAVFSVHRRIPELAPHHPVVTRRTLLYGVLAGALIATLKLIEYRYLIATRSVEMYGAIIAALFAGFGLWLGIRLTGRPERLIVREVERLVQAPTAAPAGPFQINETQKQATGITARELEILGLMADGLSNSEIADRLFISENTVKTHSARVFDKLGARRRTQAVQLGKSLGLIP
jgi:two-component system, NarL family, response regulator LiaR